MRKFVFLLLLFFSNQLIAQELFVYTEPASNMAAKSIGIRLNNYLMKSSNTNFNYHLLPELMVGASKKIMLHAEAFLSNRNNSFVAEGGSVYAKYRFYSIDDVHSHFRLAAISRYSLNSSDVHQPAIDFNGHNSGYELGLVGTKLIHKVAISTGASYLHVNDNGSEKFIYTDKERNAIAYNLSIGKLMLPKEYTDYKQTNLNIMCEFLGQTNLGSSNTFIDIAPSAQLIFDSRMRLDIGYRFAVIKDLQRTTDRGFMLRFEYNFFNAFK